jgi:predicted RNA binding protein YcfA (HicA-like mRNA interferase family)
MCKPLKQKELIRIVEAAGFIMIRSGEHKVYKKGNVTLCVPHSRTISSGVVHQAFKAIRLADSQSIALTA